jgi:hypothetical protein
MASAKIGRGRHRWGIWTVFRRWRRLFAWWTLDRFRLRELRRRSAVEPVIGHLKAEHRMGRNYLWFRRGDAANAVLAVAGYNFRRLIRWLRLLLRQILSALFAEPAIKPSLSCLAAGPMKKYLI